MTTLLAVRHPLGVLVAVPLMLGGGVHAVAGNVAGPADIIVNTGSPADFWTLINGATLTVNPGAQTLAIRLQDSSATVTDATVNGGTQTGLQTSGPLGTSTVVGSTLTSSRAAHVVGQGAQSSLSDSTLVGVGRGLSVSGGGQLRTSNTQVTAASDGEGGKIFWVGDMG